MRLLKTLTLLSLTGAIAIIGINTARAWPASFRQDSSPQAEKAGGLLLPVTVLGRDYKLAGDLPQNWFTVFIDKVPQQITTFINQDVPASVLVLLDVSGSMREQFKGRSELPGSSLKQFAQTLHPSSEYALDTFASDIQPIVDWTSDFTSLEKGMSVFDTVKLKSDVRLYDACYSGVGKIITRKKQKRVIVVITDSPDSKSEHDYDDLRKLLSEHQTPLYFIHTGALASISGFQSAIELQGQAIAEDLAKLSGGVTFFPRTLAELQDSFKRTAVSIRYQHLIGLVPTGISNDGKLHKLQVKVSPPPDANKGSKGLTVHHSEFYLAKPPGITKQK